MTHYFRLYFSIEPVVRARRLAAENEIEMCDDREDCCSGKAFSKMKILCTIFSTIKIVNHDSWSSFQGHHCKIPETKLYFAGKYTVIFLIVNTIRPFTFRRKTIHFVIKRFEKEFLKTSIAWIWNTDIAPILFFYIVVVSSLSNASAGESATLK